MVVRVLLCSCYGIRKLLGGLEGVAMQLHRCLAGCHGAVKELLKILGGCLYVAMQLLECLNGCYSVFVAVGVFDWLQVC